MLTIAIVRYLRVGSAGLGRFKHVLLLSFSDNGLFKEFGNTISDVRSPLQAGDRNSSRLNFVKAKDLMIYKGGNKFNNKYENRHLFHSRSCSSWLHLRLQG